MTYEEIREEIKGRMTEGVFASRSELIYTYYDVGKLILEVEKQSVTVTQLAQDIKIHKRTLWRCKQFVEQYPNLDMIKDGKNWSWTKILKTLPKEKKDKPTLEDRIDQFIEDHFSAESDKRKELLREGLGRWEACG